MINKEKLIKRLINTYEDYVMEACLNIPLDKIILNHPDGAEHGIVETELGIRLNNYRDVINTLTFCLLEEERFPLVKQWNADKPEQYDDLFNVMLDKYVKDES